MSSKHPEPQCKGYCAVANSPGGQGCPSGGRIHSSEPADSAAAVSSGGYHNVAGKLSTKPKQNFSWASLEEQCDVRGMRKAAFSPLFYFVLLFYLCDLSSAEDCRGLEKLYTNGSVLLLRRK